MTTRAERIHQKENYVKRQIEIAKAFKCPLPVSRKHTQTSALTCGNPDCHMCGNPRKVWKELTVQEKRMYQERLYGSD